MILQALAQYYETLAAQGKLDRPGWSDAGISYALYINDDGALEQVVSLKEEQDRGKKKVLAPRLMSLPAPVKRSSGVSPNFLWDNSSYILGIDCLRSGTPGACGQTGRHFGKCQSGVSVQKPVPSGRSSPSTGVAGLLQRRRRWSGKGVPDYREKRCRGSHPPLHQRSRRCSVQRGSLGFL